MFSGPLLIANRGEIAARIERTARRLGIETVAVFAGPDRGAPFVEQASRAYFLGEERPGEERTLYLDIETMVAAARATGAAAVHPGYGFLAENPEFARACEEAGLVFVGPRPEAMALLGDKAKAKALAQELGIPCIPGSSQVDENDTGAPAATSFPLLIKAAAGGGGRGMRVVETPAELPAALHLAASEAEAAFGRGDLLLESFLRGARHVEIQVLADRHGNVLHLGDRDCSVQRRFQKLIEEAPSPGVDDAKRRELGEAAVELVRAAGYDGAATVELLLMPDGRFYFLEVNTRLQVEHGVTELLTGLDLVEWQLRIAAGERLSWSQSEIPFTGHAIEVRLCAEDPAGGFLPQTGRIAALHLPIGVRIDHALAPGLEIGANYDSMLAKILAHGRDREEARRRLVTALEATFLAGLAINKGFLLAVLDSPQFRLGEVTTRFVEEEMPSWPVPEPPAWFCLLAAALEAERRSPSAGSDLWAFRSSGEPSVFHAGFEQGGVWRELRVEALGGRRYLCRNENGRIEIEIGGEAPELLSVALDKGIYRVHATIEDGAVHLDSGGGAFTFRFGRRHRRSELEDPGRIRAPMASRVKLLQVEVGQAVEAGQPLLVLEAMKLEHRLVAQQAGNVGALHVAVGDAVAHRQLLVEIVT